MFLPFIAVAAIATALFKFGAMSVWIKLLSAALSFTTLLLIAIGLYALRKRYKAQA
jgi:hypothetical protein